MYTLARAREEDTGTVAGLLTRRAEWLAEQGYDQWSEKDPARTTAETVAAGETWLLEDAAGLAVGTLTLTTRPDRDFWTDNATTLYLSKLATRVELAGASLGELLLHGACLYASKRTIPSLRWDVWRTNTRLQAYYQRLGAELLSVVEVPGRQSGALFKMQTHSLRILSAASAARLRIDAPTGRVAGLATDRVDATVYIGSSGWDPLGCNGLSHLHHATELVGEDGAAIVINPLSPDPLTLHHTGDQWLLNGRPVHGPATRLLQPGLLYQMKHHGEGRHCGVEILGDLVKSVNRQLQHQ